jgi:hypothetical protein
VGTTSLILTTILIWTSLPPLLIREDSGEQDVRRSVLKKNSRQIAKCSPASNRAARVEPAVMIKKALVDNELGLTKRDAIKSAAKEPEFVAARSSELENRASEISWQRSG